MFNDNFLSFPKLGLDLELSNICLQFGNVKIYWYGVLIALGFVLALVFALMNAKRWEINTDRMIDCVIVGVLGGIIGARLYFVLFNLDTYLADPIQIFLITEGGLAIFGAIIGGLGAGMIMCKIRKVKRTAMLDVASLGFLIAQAVGRWGNFFNQEAFGANTDGIFGMKLSGSRIAVIRHEYANIEGFDITKPVHPCFLYESLWCILGFVALHIVSKKWKKFDGQIFFMYIGWYGLGRFFIEGLRMDSLMLGSFRVSQIVSLLCVIGSIAALIFFFSKNKKAAVEQGEYVPMFDNADVSESSGDTESENASDEDIDNEAESAPEPAEDDIYDEADDGELEAEEIEETDEVKEEKVSDDTK